MFEGQIAKRLGGGLFPEDKMKKKVHTHAMVAAFIAAFPLPVIEQIAFIIVLWHMYSELGKCIGVLFGCSSIIIGAIVNIAFYVAYSLALEAIPVFGWLTTAGICYLQFYLSGKAYIETLKNTQ